MDANTRRLIRQLVEDKIVAGISYAYVAKNQNELYFEGVQGVIDPYDSIPLTPAMQYDLASVSKVVGTTNRILQLIEEGRLSLDTKVKTILPRFISDEITIRNLLFHNAGLPADLSDKDSLTSDNIVDRVYSAELISKPGEVIRYSDLGYILLGFIIEAIDGCTLEESFRKNIFDPIGMNSTSYFPLSKKNCVPTEITKARGCIQGETHDRKGYYLKQAGSAGIFATLGDLVLFVRSLLFGENPILKKETIDYLFEVGDDERTLGWRTDIGEKTLYHTGFTGTSILIDFKHGDALIMLANRVHPNRDNQEFIDRRKIIDRTFIENHTR